MREAGKAVTLTQSQVPGGSWFGTRKFGEETIWYSSPLLGSVTTSGMLAMVSRNASPSGRVALTQHENPARSSTMERNMGDLSESGPRCEISRNRQVESLWVLDWQGDREESSSSS